MAKSRARKLADIIVGAGIDIDGNLTFDGGSVSADLTFGDNDKANFGDASDLQIYHDGSNSYIQDNGTGSLILEGTTSTQLKGSSFVILRSTAGENMAVGNANGSFDLYYNGAKKLATTSSGIDVTSTVAITGTSPKIFLSESDTTDLNTRIRNNGGNFQIQSVNNSDASPTTRLGINNSTGDLSLYENTGTTAKFFWDASTERLGLGTTTPSHLLHVSKSSYDTTLLGLSYSSSDSGAADYAHYGEFLLQGGGSYNKAGIRGYSNAYQTGNAALAFWTQEHGGSYAERLRIMGDGQIRIDSGSYHRPIIESTNWGYSAGYRVALLGSASTSYNTTGTGSITLSMGYDPSGNTNGSFTGDGREILFRRGAQFVTPNSADTDFYNYNLVLRDGKVGIGTAPSYQLHVTDTQGDVAYIASSDPDGNGATNGRVLHIRDNYATTSLDSYVTTGWTSSPGQDVYIGKRTTSGAGYLAIKNSSGTEHFTIDMSSGRVGIGTTSPSSKLVIADSNGAGLEIIPQTSNDRTTLLSYDRNASTYQSLDLDGSDLQFNIAGTERMRVESNGNIGIGTDSPNSRLNLKLSNRGVADFRITDSATTNDVLRAGSQADGDGFLQLRTIGGAGPVLFDASGISYLTGGNFGIGTNNPGSLLQLQGPGAGGSAKNTIGFGTSGWGAPTAPNAALDGGVKLALFEGGTQKVQIGMDPNARLWLMSAGSGAQGVDIYTGSSNTVAPTLRFRVDQGGTTNIYGNLAVSSTTSTDVAVVHASGVDTSASMGGQSPKLTVAGYTSLDGLRIAGGDTGNTIYKTGGAFGLTLADSNMITLSNSNSTARLNAGNWEVLSGGQLRAYRGGNSAYGALYMDTGENLFIYNSWGAKSIVLKRDGNVGIGTTNPQDQLHILAPINSGIRLQTPTANNSFGDENRIDFHMSNEVSQGTGNPAARIASYLQRNNNGYGIKFGVRFDGSTFNTAAMTLSAEGNLGIGTASPGEDLHIYRTSGNADAKLQAAAAGSDSRLFISRNGSASRAYVNYSDVVSGANWYTGLLRNTTNIFGIGQGDDFGTNTRLCIDNGGNVGIGTTNPNSKLEVNNPSGAGNGSAQEVGRFVNTASGATSMYLYLGASVGTDWRVGKNVSGITNNTNFSIADNGGTRKLDLTPDGTVGLGTTTPITPVHKTTTLTASQSTGNSWSTSNDTGSFSSRGAIEVGGITNRYIIISKLSGNFSANTWYPIMKRSELTAAAGNGSTLQNGGFGMYFRIYMYSSSVGIGEYFTNRMTEMIWVQAAASNSTQAQEMRVGVGWGHAPNAGHDADDPSLCPIRMRVAHHLGSDSTWPSEQTIEIRFSQAITGADPAAAGKQIIVMGYMI